MRQQISSLMIHARWAVLGALALASSGCGMVERRYTWTRKEPAVDRKSPTVFVVRYKLDQEKKEVLWVLDASDREGDLGRDTETFTNCDVFDERNWSCAYGPPLAGVVSIDMRDGKLHQKYWTEERNFTTSYALSR